VALAVLGIGLAVWIGGGHGVGDPGGKILGTLEKVKAAVPPGATSVIVGRSVDAQWLPSCAEIPGSHAGWGNAATTVSFNDTDPPATIVAGIDAALQKAGWQRHDEATGPHQGKIAHWTLALPHEPSASVFAFPTPHGAPHWFISATWQPAGPIDQGCP
jgi:hypothetical protein